MIKKCSFNIACMLRKKYKPKKTDCLIEILRTEYAVETWPCMSSWRDTGSILKGTNAQIFKVWMWGPHWKIFIKHILLTWCWKWFFLHCLHFEVEGLYSGWPCSCSEFVSKVSLACQVEKILTCRVHRKRRRHYSLLEQYRRLFF